MVIFELNGMRAYQAYRKITSFFNNLPINQQAFVINPIPVIGVNTWPIFFVRQYFSF